MPEQTLPPNSLTPEEIAEWRRMRSAVGGIDWSKIAAYLPAVRSLIWMLGGAVAGGGLTYTAVPVQTKEGPEKVITKEASTQQIIEDFKKAFPQGVTPDGQPKTAAPEPIGPAIRKAGDK
jgi:hypothetical protein